MKNNLNEVKKLQRLAGLLKEDYEKQSIFGDEDEDDAPDDYLPDESYDSQKDENVSEGYSDVGVQELFPLIGDLSGIVSTSSNLSTDDKQTMHKILSDMQAIVEAIVAEDDDDYGSGDPDDDYLPASDYGARRKSDDDAYFGINEKKNKGLWANVNKNQEDGKKPSHGNSNAFKSAVKAGKEINKNK